VLTDAAGKHHAHAGTNARVVSLVPSLTELMFDLELGWKVAGRTSGCVEPLGQVEHIGLVGTTKKVDIMAVAELGPSHVLATVDDTPPALIQEIIDLGVEVIVTDCKGPEDNAALYDLIGDIFGAMEQAETLTETLHREISAARQSAAERPEKTVIYLTWKNPWITVANDSYTASMLALVGLRILGGEGGQRYPAIEIDRALLAQADLLLLGNTPFQFEDEDIQDFQLEHGIGSKPQLAIIDGRSLSWPGKRVTEGLHELSQLAATL
jgi:ABC-type Fe3+-hydroxamate transport system substrate-binding protein